MYAISSKPSIKLAKYDQVFRFYKDPVEFKILDVESRDGLNWKIVRELLCKSVYTPPYTYWMAWIVDEDDPKDLDEYSVKYDTWDDLESFDHLNVDPSMVWQGSQSEHPHGLSARWEAFLIDVKNVY